MKKLILTLLAIIPFCLFSQIPNGSFETWTNMGLYGNPDQWSTPNDYTSPAGGFTCIKGTPGNPGTSYIRLISTSIGSMGVIPAIAVCGILNTSTMQPVSGFPFTSRPENLTGNWQFMANGEDQGYISVLLSHWNPSTQSRDTVAYNDFPLPGMVMSWRNFSIPLIYKNGMNPDSAIIVASASNSNGAVTADGSYLYLDNLSFSGSVLTVSDTKQDGITIFPNPASDRVFIELSKKYSGNSTISVLDVSGREVFRSQHIFSNGKISFNLQGIPDGNYFIRIISGKEVLVRKFIHFTR